MIRINTTLLTDDEKEFLENIEHHLQVCQEKQDFHSDESTHPNALIRNYLVELYKRDEISCKWKQASLMAITEARAKRILTLCHTGI